MRRQKVERNMSQTHSESSQPESAAIDVPSDDQREWQELQEEVAVFQHYFGSPDDGGQD